MPVLPAGGGAVRGAETAVPAGAESAIAQADAAVFGLPVLHLRLQLRGELLERLRSAGGADRVLPLPQRGGGLVPDGRSAAGGDRSPQREQLAGDGVLSGVRRAPHGPEYNSTGEKPIVPLSSTRRKSGLLWPLIRTPMMTPLPAWWEMMI